MATRAPLIDTPESRVRYYDPENFFAFRWPDVPRHQFLDERNTAYSEKTPSGETLLDCSSVLKTAYPATTPLLLARYLTITTGDTLTINRRASAEIFYVLEGEGTSTGLGERIEWRPGDAFCFPGGEVQHTANQRAVIFSVCNEPLLRFEDLYPSSDGHERVRPLHWARDEMDREFEAILARPESAEVSGRALQLAAADMEPARHPIPSMNVAINTLEPGGDQRPHRHNGVAITLAVESDAVYSMIEEQKVDWIAGAAQITPATELHSHHNRGSRRMVSLVVQDEGLHFYTRTPGFSWD